ncbi:MAG: class I SAM-dependent methyltransferase [Geminicoccaceae bacterium]
MTNGSHKDAVVTYYDTHPINEQQILEKLKRDGIPLEGLSEADLQNYDQDHYGGIEITEQLARDAGIGADHHVLDVCSGMGGPARYFSYHRGCRVTGLDLTGSRVAGATRLTSLVGLNHRVDYRQGDAQAMPFEDATFDVAISQEALLHVPDKEAVIQECARVLKPGGMLVITDLTQRQSIAGSNMLKLGKALASVNFATAEKYRQWLQATGFEILTDVDRSEELKAILTERLYKSLGDQTRGRFGVAREKEWEEGYTFFVDSVVAGRLGGCRFAARKKSLNDRPLRKIDARQST